MVDHSRDTDRRTDRRTACRWPSELQACQHAHTHLITDTFAQSRAVEHADVSLRLLRVASTLAKWHQLVVGHYHLIETR